MPFPARLEAIRQRTEEWLAATDVVGESERDLIAAAGDRDILVRVIARDGEGFLLRADRRPNRVNVEVVDGRVSRVDGVY